MSKPKQKLSATVEVYRPGAPTTNGKPRDVQILRVRRGEANWLVNYGAATWRGRQRQAITTTVPAKAVLMFVGQMRYIDRAPMAGADSKTFAAHGPNPWKGVRHVRNESYTAAADELMGSVHAVDAETNRDPLEALFRNLLAGLRGGSKHTTAPADAPGLRFPYKPERAAA